MYFLQGEGLRSIIQFSHSREGGNLGGQMNWIPTFAGMTD